MTLLYSSGGHCPSSSTEGPTVSRNCRSHRSSGDFFTVKGCHASFTRPREKAILKNCPHEIGVLVPSPRETSSWVSGPLMKSAFWCPALVKRPHGYRDPFFVICQFLLRIFPKISIFLYMPHTKLLAYVNERKGINL